MADAHGSGPCDSNIMRVQVPFPAGAEKPWNTEKSVVQGFLFSISLFLLLCYNLLDKQDIFYCSFCSYLKVTTFPLRQMKGFN